MERRAKAECRLTHGSNRLPFPAADFSVVVTRVGEGGRWVDDEAVYVQEGKDVAVLMLELVIEISLGGLAVPAREPCDYFPESW